MDKSFEGLLISIVVHVALIAFLFNADLKPITMPRAATEITIIEKPEDKEGGRIVPQTYQVERDEPDLKDLEDAARILSQFTERVKKQMLARKEGPTTNTAPGLSKTASHRGNKDPKLLEENDALLRRGDANPLRNVAIGAMSMADRVAGIQEGYFTALNTDQFIYTIFYGRVTAQFRPRWINHVRNYMQRLSEEKLKILSSRNRETVIEVILGPDGSYFTSLIHRSSGDDELDQANLQSFRDAAPFPNPPQGMIDKDGLIHLYYVVTIHFLPTFGPAG